MIHLLGKICLFLVLVNVDSRYLEQYRPCSFNPLCTCSNGGPDLGSVSCHNVPFMTIPTQINNSAIYIMSMKYNKLRFLEDNSLNGTGLWKLQINNNLITNIPARALSGLEKTLSILDLSENELVRVPREAIRNLEKIQNLNLAGNHISSLHKEDFRGISKSLKVLDLSDNALTAINNDVLKNMPTLEMINLAFNALHYFDNATFQNGQNLRHINLMGNQFQEIPLNALINLKNLKTINMNENIISYISEGKDIRNRFNLEELDLEYNLIENLTPESFKIFNSINRIFLKGNPITTLNDTFVTLKITELYMQNCAISFISKNAFNSLKQTLEVLDLSYNDLKDIPSLPLKRLIKLNLAGNEIQNFEPDDVKQFGNTLKYLDIRGQKMNIFSPEIMKHLPNLRELYFTMKQGTISSNYMINGGPAMEKLHIVKSSVKNIESGAFHQLSGVKQLDLSYNKLSRFGNGTFRDLGHSLEKLVLHNALKMSVFPHKTLHHLSKLQYLDISKNYLGYLPYDSLSFFPNLMHVNLNHNELKDLSANFINDMKNPNLLQLKMAFNRITSLKSHTFKNLQKLIYLQLNDNHIRTIEKSAFLDLDSLITIELEGNLIEYIDNEAFQNLPKIQFINLAYNKLTALNLEAFDQVGRLSTLKIDVDHNEIDNLTGIYDSSHSSNNVKSIDFSHNNISYIDNNYFDPIRLSIHILDFSYNQIPNLTNLAFTHMTHLQTLILSHNEIDVIEEDELKGLHNLQIFDVSHNKLKKLSSDLFDDQYKLRIFSIHHNHLEQLSRDMFSSTVLEQLDLSFNRLEEFPEVAILPVRDTIQYLDMAGNHIKCLNFTNMNKFRKLKHLSISQNGLHLPNPEEELHLPNLISLDLSHNNMQDLPQWILRQLPRSLESLNLANMSLRYMPVLDTYNMLLLNLSTNFIQNVRHEALEKLTKLQTLDFSSNRLPETYNNVWSDLQQLRALYLDANPIQSLSNSSFQNMERLQELFMKNLKLDYIQKDSFHPLKALKKIEMDTYPRMKNITISQLLNKNHALREVHLHVQENELDGSLHGNMTKSLKAITLEGKNLKQVHHLTFADINSQELTLDIRNTNITKLSRKLFQNMEDVKNFTASFTNNKLQTIERMFPARHNEVQNKYLKQLELSGNQIQCSCELAWIWEWLSEYEYHNECNEISCELTILHDLRETRCINMENKSIIDAFKTDLVCFSSGTSVSLLSAPFEILLILALLCFSLEKFL